MVAKGNLWPRFSFQAEPHWPFILPGLIESGPGSPARLEFCGGAGDSTHECNREFASLRLGQCDVWPSPAIEILPIHDFSVRYLLHVVADQSRRISANWEFRSLARSLLER